MANKLRPCLLIYDIPEDSDLENPSGFLYRRGVRVNLSCWVIPEERIPYWRLNQLREGGATWHVVRFADDQTETILTMVRESLAKQAEEARQRAEQSFANAQAEMPEQGETHCLNRNRATARRVSAMLADLAIAATSFGVSTDPLDEALRRIRVAHTLADKRARAVARQARDARRVGLGTMADAIEADEAPPLIAADAIEEAGEDQTEVRDLFSEEE